MLLSSHFFSLFHLCILRYNCILMRKRLDIYYVKACLFWNKMNFRLGPDVNAVLISFFLSLFSSLRPRISIHSSFIMLLVHLVFFWSFLLGLLMFFHCSVAMLVSVSLLCPFSVKMSIKKSISLWIFFSVYFVQKKTFEYPHSNMWCCYILVWFYLYIC